MSTHRIIVAADLTGTDHAAPTTMPDGRLAAWCVGQIGGNAETYASEDVFAAAYSTAGPLARFAGQIISNLPATPSQIAALRYEIEQGGISVMVSHEGGTSHRFDTSRESRVNWLVLEMAARGNPAYVFSGWKTLDSQFIDLSNNDILNICEKVRSHVPSCFATERILLEDIPSLGELRGRFMGVYEGIMNSL